jgi:GTPase involved in cell partitioning and DNA repair
MIDITSEDYTKDYKTLITELNKYSKILGKKKKVTLFFEADLVESSKIKNTGK